MHVSADITAFAVLEVVDAWDRKTVEPDPDYQRGLAWKPQQQQLLIDSILRGYPLPRFYLYAETHEGLLGGHSEHLLVIDGLQRINALAEYRSGHWPLLDPAKAPDYFPPEIRRQPCPWAGRTFSDLDAADRERLLATQLPFVVIDRFDSADEVRDLFIRLQAGTALTRQQVRDAWPGNVGPFIERLAGRLKTQPRFAFFSRIDRRGVRRDEEEELEDRHHDARMTCAQLLRLYLERGPAPVSSRYLDVLYHTATDFDAKGEDAQGFQAVLGYCESILAQAPLVTTGGGKGASVTKPRLFSLFLALAEFHRNPNIRLDRELEKVATVFWRMAYGGQFDGEPTQGKGASGPRIEAHSRWFQSTVLPDANLTFLDPKRSFDTAQQAELWGKAADVCELCQKPLNRWDEIDFDHIDPWVRGGRTTTDNGRAVHRRCNRQRGEGSNAPQA